MKLIYRPEGGEEQTWVFRPEKLRSVEAEAIERVTDWTYDEFASAFLRDSIRARRALLWILRKRSTPTLRFVDVDFAIDELQVRFDDEELAQMAARRDELAQDDPTREVLDDLLATYDAERADAAGPKGNPPPDSVEPVGTVPNVFTISGPSPISSDTDQAISTS